MTRKRRYEVDLTISTGAEPVSSSVRSVTPEHLDALARLMLDAYKGTIDYDGEDLADAISEVRRFLESETSLLDRSLAIEQDGTLVTAILVSASEGQPFIEYVMTLPTHKNQGFGRLVTSIALRRLAVDGYDRAILYITEGNVASEALFRSVGAVIVDD